MKDKDLKDLKLAILCQLTGKEISKPRRRNPVNVWRKTQQAAIQAVVQTRAAASSVPNSQLAALRDKVAREMYNSLSDTAKAHWTQQANDETDTAIAQWRSDLLSGSSTDPADRQRSIQRLVGFLQPFLDHLCESTGLAATMIMGGPEPARGGKLDVVSVHSGTSNGAGEMDLGHAERAQYMKNLVPIFGSFLQNCYTPEECNSRALGVPGSMPLDPDDFEQLGASLDYIDDPVGADNAVAGPSGAVADPNESELQLPGHQQNTPPLSTDGLRALAMQGSSPLDPDKLEGPGANLDYINDPSNAVNTVAGPSVASQNNSESQPPHVRHQQGVSQTTTLPRTSLQAELPVTEPPLSTGWRLLTPRFIPPHSRSGQVFPSQDVSPALPAARASSLLEDTSAHVPAEEGQPDIMSSEGHQAFVAQPVLSPGTGALAIVTQSATPEAPVVQSDVSTGDGAFTILPSAIEKSSVQPPVSPGDEASAIVAHSSVHPCATYAEVAIQVEPFDLIFSPRNVSQLSPPTDLLATASSQDAMQNIYPGSTTPKPALINVNENAHPASTSDIVPEFQSTSNRSLDGGTAFARENKGRGKKRRSEASDVAPDHNIDNPPSKRFRARKSGAASSTVLASASAASTSALKTHNFTTPSDAPKWFENGLLMLQNDELGAPWAALLKSWVAFEIQENFVEVAKLSTAHRPVCVKDWIQRARSTTWRPSIADISAFEATFRKWWASLQPDWRLSGSGDVDFTAVEGDWGAIRRPGLNGLFSVIAALFYWGLAVQKKNGQAKWQAAVEDCRVVCTHLLHSVG